MHVIKIYTAVELFNTHCFGKLFYFCQWMKRHREISLGILLLMAILICLGLHTYSSCNSQPYSIQLSEGTDSGGNTITSDIDSCNNDDQTPQLFRCRSIVEPLCLILVSPNLIILGKFSSSIWQPPKTC
jgi:hypothetical protein